MKFAVLCLMLFSGISYAQTPDECKALIRKFNSSFKDTEWGYDTKLKSLIMKGTKGKKPGIEEKAMSSSIKRVCMSSGLSLTYYLAFKGSNKAFSACQITDGKSLAQVCESSDFSLNFTKP